MNHEDAILTMKTGWSLGKWIGRRFGFKKNETPRLFDWEDLVLLAVFVFLLSATAILAYEGIQSRMA